MPQCRLKYCTARSCRSAAARVPNVPRLRRFPVRGFFFLEYNRYLPDFSLRIMALDEESYSGEEGSRNEGLDVDRERLAPQLCAFRRVDERLRTGIQVALTARRELHSGPVAILKVPQRG